MKKYILTLAMALAAMFMVSASDTNPYIGVANVPNVQLNNGLLMPQFGLGTFLQPNDSVCYNSVSTALKAGYRHIDTAHAYGDERGVGKAVKESAMSQGALLRDPEIVRIAEAHGKTPAQVILRWHIQEGLSAIPGATNPDYIDENIQIFDFELTDSEMQAIRSLNKEKRFFNMTLPEVENMVNNYPLTD